MSFASKWMKLALLFSVLLANALVVLSAEECPAVVPMHPVPIHKYYQQCLFGPSPTKQRRRLEKRGQGMSSARNGGMRVCNESDGPIHIALGMLGPLHWENWVHPGHCMTRDNIGNVWFSITVRAANTDNEFEVKHAVLPILSLVMPIVGVGLGGTSLALRQAITQVLCQGASTQAIFAASMLHWACVAGSAGATLIAGGTIPATVMEHLRTREYGQDGFYANCHHYSVRGGPHFVKTAEGHVLMDFGKTPRKYYILDGGHY